MWYRSFIPEKISDRKVIGFLDGLRKMGRRLRFGRAPSDHGRIQDGDAHSTEKRFGTAKTGEEYITEGKAGMEQTRVTPAAGTGFLESQNSYGDIADHHD